MIKKSKFGEVIVHKTDYEPHDICGITGMVYKSPRFINKIDENLWRDFWNDKSEKLGIKYAHTQDRFDKDFKNYVTKDEELEACGKISDLLESYFKASERYNKEIVEPHIQERKNLLNKILEV